MTCVISGASSAAKGSRVGLASGSGASAGALPSRAAAAPAASIAVPAPRPLAALAAGLVASSKPGGAGAALATLETLRRLYSRTWLGVRGSGSG